MDLIDKKILFEIQKDANRSHGEIAEVVGLSTSACHRRIRALEAEGVISGYVALLNNKKIDQRAVVFVEITLNGQSEEKLDAFERAVQNFPGLLECHLMAGTADYQLKIIAKNVEAFTELHRQYLSRLPHVASMQSSFALKTVYRTTMLPLE